MEKLIEEVVKDYDSGKVSRRDFVGQITAIVALLAGANSAALGQKESSSAFTAIEINHLAIKVTDLDRTQKFYEEVLGMKVIKRVPGILFMSCGTHFIAFMKRSEAGLDHFCLTLEKYNQAEVLEKLKALGIESKTEEVRTYFADPDGNLLQLAHDDYPTSQGRPNLSNKLKKQIYGGKSDYVTNPAK